MQGTNGPYLLRHKEKETQVVVEVFGGGCRRHRAYALGVVETGCKEPARIPSRTMPQKNADEN